MDVLAHFFLPRSTNNYRAKLLHHQVLLSFVIILLAGSFVFAQVKRNYPQVLGITTNITSEQLISITNEKRKENGLLPLSLNSSLSTAAESKAQDMFAKDYWAHISPTGTTPWVFIKGAGYNYVYAGENLAKGFSNAQEAVDAWMASPDHRENELSQNYQDVGFAVKTGKLNGEDTVLIVEEFGGKALAQASKSSGIQPASSPPAVPTVEASSLKPFINSVLLSSNIYTALLGMFIVVLALDMIVVEKHKIVRIAGHNIDHILFFTTILLAGMILIKGVVL